MQRQQSAPDRLELAAIGADFTVETDSSNVLQAGMGFPCRARISIIWIGSIKSIETLHTRYESMPNQVSMGALLQCTFGVAPSSLVVLPKNKVMGEGPPAANIMDHIPMVNIMPFGMCNSPANPMVAAATAAALGVLTPMPCIPATSAPWVPGAPTVILGFMPSLDNVSKCMCNWGGVISINNPATTKTMIP